MIKIIKKIIIITKIMYFIIKYKKEKNIENIKKIKNLILKMGPVYIKFIQLISLRTDFFDKEIIQEFEKFQTHTKIIPFEKIKKIIEKTTNESINKTFKKINENPLASASIAQIHTAISNENKKIVIKILKPGIKKIIKFEIKIFYYLSKFINNLFKNSRRLKLIDIIDELKKSFENETNLENEAKNIIKIKNNLKKYKYVYIPNINNKISKKNILITEYIDGINIINKEKIEKNKINTLELSKNLIEIFYIQVFKNNIYHADFHPGNILVSKNKKNTPIITLLDFGIIGTIRKKEKIYLSENLLAFVEKNYKKIAYLHFKAETIKTKENIKEIEKELYNIFNPISNKSLKETQFKDTILKIIELNKKFNAQLQPNLILFQKTLITIEGICRNINNNINLWTLTRKIIEKIIIYKIIKNKIIKNKKEINNQKIKNSIKKKSKINKFFSKKIINFITLYSIFLIIMMIIIKIQNMLIFSS